LTEGSPAILLKSLLEIRGIKSDQYDPYIDTAVTDFKLEKKIYFIGCKHSIFSNYDFPEGSCVIDPNRYIPLTDGVDIVHVGIGK